MLKRNWVRRVREWLPLLEGLSYLAGVLSLSLIAIQLIKDSDDRKLAQSMAMVQRFNSEPLSTSRSTLMQPWLPYQDSLREVNKRGGMGRQEIGRLVREVLARYDQAHPEQRVYLAINDVAEFYDQLRVCIDSDVCDSKTAKVYFQPTAQQFWCLYGPIVKDQAEAFAMPNLVTGITSIAGQDDCR